MSGPLAVSLAIGAVVGVGAYVVLRRLFPDRPAARVEVERCEVCDAGLTVDEVHVLTATFDDGLTAEASPVGGTGMAAFYCAEHCPGGCQRERMAAWN